MAMEEGKEVERSVPRDDSTRMRALNARFENWIARSRLKDDRVKQASQAETELRKRLEEEKKRACAELQKIIEQERANVQKLSTAYNDVTHQLNVKRDNVNSLKRDLADSQKEVGALKEQLENVTSDLTSEKTEQVATRDAHAKVSRLLKDSEAKNRKLEESLAAVRKERSTLQAEKVRIESMQGLSADDLKKMRAKWVEQVNRLKEQVKGLQAKNGKLSEIFFEKYNKMLTEQTQEIERQQSEAYAQELTAKEAFYDKRIIELQQGAEDTANELVAVKSELLQLSAEKTDRERLETERDRLVIELEKKSAAVIEERRRFSNERNLMLQQINRLKAHYVALEKSYNELKKNKLEFVAAIGNTKALLDDEDRRNRESGELADVNDDADLLKFVDDQIHSMVLTRGSGKSPKKAPAKKAVVADGDERKEGEPPKKASSSRASAATRSSPRRRSTRGRVSKAATTTPEDAGDKAAPSRKRKRASDKSESSSSSSSSSSTAATAAATASSSSSSVAVSTRRSTRSRKSVAASSSASSSGSGASSSSSSEKKEAQQSGGKRKASALDPPTPKVAEKADTPNGHPQPQQQPKGGDEERKPTANGVDAPVAGGDEEASSPLPEPAAKRQRVVAANKKKAPALAVRFDAASRAIVAKNVCAEPVSLKDYRMSVGSKTVRLQRERVLPPGGECYFYASMDDCDKYGKKNLMKVAFGENSVKFTPAMESTICLESPDGTVTMVDGANKGGSCLIM